MFRAATVDGVLVSFGVIVPVRALLPIGYRELPGFDRICLAFEESLLLLIFVDRSIT